MSAFIDLTGIVFGRLTVLRREGTVRGQAAWRCRCECGNETVVGGYELRSWHTISCGCYHRQVAGANFVTHGESRRDGAVTPEWNCWSHLRRRCLDVKARDYPRYGGRGITVCERWQGPDGFAHFLSDMGPRPSEEHSIDRKDNDGPYSPDNCRWATPEVQQANTRRSINLTFRGRTQTLLDWSSEVGIAYGTIWYRIKQGWGVERALSTTTGGR